MSDPFKGQQLITQHLALIEVMSMSGEPLSAVLQVIPRVVEDEFSREISIGVGVVLYRL